MNTYQFHLGQKSQSLHIRVSSQIVFQSYHNTTWKIKLNGIGKDRANNIGINWTGDGSRDRFDPPSSKVRHVWDWNQRRSGPLKGTTQIWIWRWIEWWSWPLPWAKGRHRWVRSWEMRVDPKLRLKSCKPNMDSEMDLDMELTTHKNWPHFVTYMVRHKPWMAVASRVYN